MMSPYEVRDGRIMSPYEEVGGGHHYDVTI